jgi:uncharacterized protein YndB with AHSA1/START domain
MMKWFIRLLVVLGIIILAMFITGSVLPTKHTATSTMVFTASREEVWKVLSDFNGWPSWRTDLKEIHDGSNTFTEVSSDGESIEYRVDDFTPPERLITTIITPDLPFGGSWTYELTAAETGCTLTITENGEVYNPMFRFMSKYMFGHNATMEQYLGDLKKKIQ